MSNEVQFPHNSVRLFDTEGRMTREGLRFFLALWERTGGGNGNLDVSVIDGGTGAGATTFARGDGTWAVPAYPVGANPSGQVGTSAANGVATTWMRSDAAPALNLGITPTWTGAHAFSGGLTGTSLALSDAFGCNGATAQTEAAVSAAVAGTAGVTYTATEQGIINNLVTLVNQLRAALVANGVCV